MRNTPGLALGMAALGATLATSACTPKTQTPDDVVAFECKNQAVCDTLRTTPLRMALSKTIVEQPISIGSRESGNLREICKVLFEGRVIAEVPLGKGMSIPTADHALPVGCNGPVQEKQSTRTRDAQPSPHGLIIPVADQGKTCQKEENAASIANEKLADLQEGANGRSPETEQQIKFWAGVVLATRNALERCRGKQQQPLRRDYQGT